MKKLILIIIPVICFTIANGQDFNTAAAGRFYQNNINSKALRDFVKRFESAGDVDWSGIKGGYTARFRMDDIRVRADYSLKGEWLNTLRYYQEEKLPRPIRSLVKSRYYDYSIDLVIEITWQEKTMYEVHLSDTASLKNIRVYDDEIIIVGEYDKKPTGL